MVGPVPQSAVTALLYRVGHARGSGGWGRLAAAAAARPSTPVCAASSEICRCFTLAVLRMVHKSSASTIFWLHCAPPAVSAGTAGAANATSGTSTRGSAPTAAPASSRQPVASGPDLAAIALGVVVLVVSLVALQIFRSRRSGLGWKVLLPWNWKSIGECLLGQPSQTS